MLKKKEKGEGEGEREEEERIPVLVGGACVLCLALLQTRALIQAVCLPVSARAPSAPVPRQACPTAAQHAIGTVYPHTRTRTRTNASGHTGAFTATSSGAPKASRSPTQTAHERSQAERVAHKIGKCSLHPPPPFNPRPPPTCVHSPSAHAMATMPPWRAGAAVPLPHVWAFGRGVAVRGTSLVL